MAKKIGRFIVWLPRILSILLILTMALLSLDVISPQLNFRQILAGLLMHNIPALAMTIVLMAAWKHELVGGIAFLLAGFLYILMTAQAKIDRAVALSWDLTLAGPALLIGILFLLSWFKKRRE